MSSTSALNPTRPGTLRASHLLALISCLGLIMLGLGWELIWAPTGSGTLALKVLPLLAALPGLWQARLYTFRWLSLALWLYVAEGCVRAASDAGIGRWLGGLETLLGLALFVGCAWQVRAQLTARRQAPSPHA